MKRILTIFLFLFLTVLSFAGTIKSVKLNGAVLTMDFAGSQKPKYTMNYDEYNKLIFLEFPDSTLTGKINNKNFTGKYIESLEVVDYSGSVGFLLN